MKYPLSKSEWKWATVGTFMITMMCLGFALVMVKLTGNEFFLPGTGLVWLFILYIGIVKPILDRI